MMRTIRRKARDLDTPSQLRAWLMATVPPGEALQLLTPAAARALLTPVDLARPSRDLTDVVSSNGTFLGVPPAWACPDVSSALPPDRFAVVAGARLHPTGALALPVVAASGVRLTVINTSAFAVNPRLGAPIAAGDRRWWAHPGLANHAVLDAGALEAPDRLAAGGVWRAVDVVVSPEVRQPQLAPHLLPKPPRMRTALDVPKLSGVEEAPTLLVTVGQLVESGADWLKIPTRHLAQRSDDEDSALKEVLEDTLGDSLGAVLRGGLTDRLPWDTAVRVVAVGLEEVKRLGVTLAWRAWIEVVPVGGGWQVVGRDGRMVRVEQGWWPEDLPHTLDGETFEAGLPGLAGETPCISGLDGELLEVQVVHGLSVVPDVPESREHDVIAAGRSTPRPSVRSMGERFSHTRLRWLADGAPATMVKALDAGALHRQVLLWCAGLAGPPQSAPVEDIQAVPLTSKPEAVSGALSDLRWVAVCLCGAVRGAAFLGRICEQCDTVVAPFEEVIRLRRAVLPMPVLHPWARELAAALLGLLPEELPKLLTRHGPTSVLSACRAALTQPGSNGRARLGLSDGHPRRVDGQARRRLGQLIELVEATPEPASLFGFLAVEQVGLPCLPISSRWAAPSTRSLLRAVASWQASPGCMARSGW
ncbi:MAG: hypothetical protein IPG17_30690 [Sandaracinaceae bacterium]|nr:hypothetical protein [Sandaracinaceae bacterium]